MIFLNIPRTIFGRFTALSLSFLVCLAAAPSSALAAEPNEAQLVQVLQSNAGPAQKDAACARLKVVGTAASVPALAGLLEHPELSHSARYALESMAFPEARLALEQALTRVQGPNLAGIIHSLEVQANPASAAVLKPLIVSGEEEVAAIAARVYGRLSSDPGPLFAGFEALPPSLRNARADGLLLCGENLLREGKLEPARQLFERLLGFARESYLQLAAYRGIFLSTPAPAREAVLVKAIAGASGPAQAAGLQLAREPGSPAGTRDLCALLPKLAPPIQVALIEALGQRGDASAAGPITAFALGAAPELRLVAIPVLGNLGDENTVNFLAETAATGTPPEKVLARQALTDIHRGNVGASLVKLLSEGSPAVQAEMARALGARGDRPALPLLFELARSTDDQKQLAALSAVAALSGEGEVPALVDIIISTPGDSVRDAAAEALNTTWQRILARGQALNLQPVLDALPKASVPAQASLLGVLGNTVNPQARAALLGAAAHADPQVRAAAIRAMASSEDPALLAGLVRIANSTPEENLKTLAISGCAKLASDEHGGSIPGGTRVQALESLLAGNLTGSQQRLVISALGGITQPESLPVLVKALSQSGATPEITRAILAVATELPGDPQAAAALEQAHKASTDAATRAELEKALVKIRAANTYIPQWRVYGPFRQEGKNYAALFDIPFGPETPAGANAEFRAVRAGGNPRQPGLIDLLDALGGQQAVAYVQVWVYSPENQKALLELATDDGVKAWLNGRLIHANNAARPIQAGLDIAPAELRQGANSLLLKITQNDQGWEFTARFLKPGGAVLEGLRFSTEEPK